MRDFVEHIRIFEINPDDDFVTKRTAAVKVVATKISKRNKFDDLLAAANELAEALFEDEIESSSICQDMVEALQSKSPSFSLEGNTVQVAVCFAMAILQVIRNAAPDGGRVTSQTYLAMAMWSALAHRTAMEEPKIESLRLTMLEEARQLILESALKSRERTSVPSLPSVDMPLETEGSSSGIFDEGAKKTVEALSVNAALDREELDLLWWVVGNWSDTAGKRITELGELTGAIFSAFEIAGMLRRVPGEAHKNMALRAISKDNIITANGLLNELDGEGSKLADQYPANSQMVSDNPQVFPLLYYIRAQENGERFGTEELKISEWGARALVECSLARLTNVPVKLL